MTVVNCSFAGNHSIGGTDPNGTTESGQGLGGHRRLVRGRSTGDPDVDRQQLHRESGHGREWRLAEQFASGTSPVGGAFGGGVAVGGGTLNIIGSSFTGNQAIGGTMATGAGGSSQGGAVQNDGGTLSVSDSTFTGNLAQSGGNGNGSGFMGAPALGGGIDTFGTATITSSTFLGNQAIGGAGGSSTAGGLGAGGGLDVSFISSATFTGCTFVGNLAQGGPGGPSNAGGDGIGGGISEGVQTPYFTGPFTANLTVIGSTLTGNTAQGGAGGAESRRRGRLGWRPLRRSPGHGDCHRHGSHRQHGHRRTRLGPAAATAMASVAASTSPPVPAYCSRRRRSRATPPLPAMTTSMAPSSPFETHGDLRNSANHRSCLPHARRRPAEDDPSSPSRGQRRGEGESGCQSGRSRQNSSRVARSASRFRSNVLW